MNFDIKILGSNSAKPAHGRHQSAQLLSIGNQYLLVDCGEGTQLRLEQYNIKISKIHHIFISHLHGDHYFGLIGLISTMHLQRRLTPLNIYGPKGLAEIISLQLKYSDTDLNFPINFRELKVEGGERVYEDNFFYVETIPLIHRVPCTGFLFREKPKERRIIKESLNGNIKLQEIVQLKKGNDIKDDQGNVLYKNSDYTLPPKKARSYAYCSDTSYQENIVPQIQNVDVLYHESTFLKDRTERAAMTCHSTAEQAAQIAKKANVGTLMLGHYSSRYKDLSPFLTEAIEVFDQTILSKEGETISIPD